MKSSLARSEEINIWIDIRKQRCERSPVARVGNQHKFRTPGGQRWWGNPWKGQTSPRSFERGDSAQLLPNHATRIDGAKWWGGWPLYINVPKEEIKQKEKSVSFKQWSLGIIEIKHFRSKFWTLRLAKCHGKLSYGIAIAWRYSREFKLE